eukprot:TRINITY_DN10787_c0_g1_i2.p1 TRINITY_DN10787_c0_g1~~TRINITY_DN10787_c0_g1_i2.p1  ORF type:complete len:353 (+),score=46.92 TRINITY_DN10787_c0_g1_i2:311-1369(+)
MPCVYIDYSLSRKEAAIAKQIHDKFYKVSTHKLSKVTSFFNVVSIMKKRINLNAPNGAKSKPMYIIFFHAGRMLRKKLFHKILSLSSALSFRLLIASDEFVPATQYCNQFTLLIHGFVLVPMHPPNPLHLKLNLYKRFEDKCGGKEFKNFLLIVYQEFGQYIAGMKYYEYLCKELLPVYLSGMKKGQNYTEEFKCAMKSKIKNLFIPVATGFKESSIKTIALANSKARSSDKSKLSQIQGILLVSAYIACSNPIKNDIKLFGEHPLNKGKLSNYRATDMKCSAAKKAELERVISIAEYFLFIDGSRCFERHLFGHSSLFYAQLNSLVQGLSLIHICRCRRIERCRSRWSPYH